MQVSLIAESCFAWAPGGGATPKVSSFKTIGITTIATTKIKTATTSGKGLMILKKEGSGNGSEASSV